MKPGETLLFHMSDIHFGVEDKRALCWFEDAVRRERPDAVICTGDLTQRATHDQYAAAADWFGSLQVPVMLMPGNHDMPYYNPIERFARPYARFGALEQRVGSELALDHLIIVPFDTNVVAQWRWPWSDGVVKKSKLDRALDRLAALAGDPRPKVVACHHPLLPARTGEKNPTIRGEKAFARLAEAGALAVLSGHVHRPFDLQRSADNQAMRMIGAGTLSTRLRGADPSYNVIAVSAAGAINVEQRDLPAIG